MAVKQVFTDFSQWTSAHGVPHIGASQNKWLKLFWAVILIFSLCMFCMQLSQLIVKYLDYDVTVQTELKFDKIPFPTITLCNINAYSWSRIKAEKGNHDGIMAMYTALETYEGRETTTDSEDAQMQGEAEEKVTYAAAGLPEAMKKKIVYDVQDSAGLEQDKRFMYGLMARCSYEQEICDPKNVTDYMDLVYGRCIVFNPDGDVMSDQAGPDNGLRILAISNQDEYMPTTDSVGVRMAVHMHDKEPYIDAFGYNAAAGFRTSFGVQFVQMDRRPAPHGNCTYNEHLGQGYEQIPYSVEGCFRACFQDAVIAQCNCAAPKFATPSTEGVTYCTDTTDGEDNQSGCVEQVLNGTHPAIGDVINTCDCPQPCKESTYAVTVSTAVFPSKAYHPPECKGDNNDKVWPWNSDPDNKLTGKELEEACTNWFRDNTMMLEIYYERMNFQLLRESEAYKLVNLISDLGGQLGLWLGVSVITIIEVIAFALMCCSVICGKKKVEEGGEDGSPFDGTK